MRGEADERATRVANGILAAIVAEAAHQDAIGPFALDDFLRAWLRHDADTLSILPDPPGSPDSSENQRRTYWFYEGCRALETSAWIAEVGDGKFAVASLTVLVAQVRGTDATPRD